MIFFKHSDKSTNYQKLHDFSFNFPGTFPYIYIVQFTFNRLLNLLNNHLLSFRFSPRIDMDTQMYAWH